MVRPRAEFRTLRFSRLEKERLLLALVFSLLAHVGIWGGYEVGKKTGLWNKLHWPVRPRVQLVQAKPVVQPVDPVIFVDVSDPATEPPKQAKFYSDKNSKAANPNAERDTDQPKLTGKQTVVPKTEDTPKPVKANPTPPTQPQPPEKVAKPAEAKPTTALNPGAGNKAKPENTTTPNEKPAPPERPRTLQQARAQQSNKLAGLQMQQDGGVKRHAPTSTLDALSTSFGGYDREIITAIQDSWYRLLDSQQFASDRTGVVTVYFHLNSDGTATELQITSNTVGNLLGYVCQAAIEQAGPFRKWDSDMRRKFGANFREVTFTFYYY